VIRRRREGKVFSLDQSTNSDEPWSVQISSPRANPEQGLQRHEARRLLASAISELAPDLRQVYLLLDVLNYSTQKVAQPLGLSPVAVRLRLLRAHRKFREKLNRKFLPGRRTSTSAKTPPRRQTKPG
jgi:RNA polymerase sigma-70 factor (ECF subfamily)